MGLVRSSAALPACWPLRACALPVRRCHLRCQPTPRSPCSVEEVKNTASLLVQTGQVTSLVRGRVGSERTSCTPGRGGGGRGAHAQLLGAPGWTQPSPDAKPVHGGCVGSTAHGQERVSCQHSAAPVLCRRCPATAGMRGGTPTAGLGLASSNPDFPRLAACTSPSPAQFACHTCTSRG